MKYESISNERVHQNLNRSALAVAIATTLALPLGFFAVSYHYETHRIQAQADLGARVIAEIVNQNPSAWAVETRELNIADRLTLNPAGRTVILDREGALVAAGTAPAAPTIKGSATILGGDTPVGGFHVIESLQPVLLSTGIAAMLGGAIGAGLFFLFGRVPLRSLRQAQAQVEASQKALYEEIRAKERALKKAEHTGQAIKHLAYHDLLTDLPNRSMLQDQLQDAIGETQAVGKRLALITLDLDSFKEINDTLGHNKGDLVIREVGSRLRGSLKRTDLIARTGGDEFAIMLRHIDKVDDVTDIANRVLEVLEKPFALDGYSFDVSASLGIVLYPDHGSDPKTLMQRADVAMYLAKDSKKDFLVYNSEIDPNSIGHLTLKGELRNAIEQGKLLVYYQPKIDLKTGLINGVESLVRWVHPERGFVGPDQFIPLAEQTGLIHPLTGLVFNVSLHQCAQWHHSHMDLGVAINISVHSLHDIHLPERIMDMLTTWDIPASKLTLEVTESAIMAEPQRALEVLTRLDEMGVSISIDDYGTGYSSLSYLKKLPVQEIKIDRSFVKDMVRNENDAVIVRATIDMAHDLGLKVTAEGIEDQQTWDALVTLGCDQAQGFYMGRPLPANDLADWMKESQWGLGDAANSAA